MRVLVTGGAGFIGSHTVDRLVADWRGRGGVAVGSSLRHRRLFADRSGDALILRVESV